MSGLKWRRVEEIVERWWKRQGLNDYERQLMRSVWTVKTKILDMVWVGKIYILHICLGVNRNETVASSETELADCGKSSATF